MGCLKQHALFNELKSCTQPDDGHHDGIAGWQSAKQQLAPCFSSSAPSLRFLLCQISSGNSCSIVPSNPFGSCSIELADGARCRGWGALKWWKRWADGYLTNMRTTSSESALCWLLTDPFWISKTIGLKLLALRSTTFSTQAFHRAIGLTYCI